MVPVDGGLDKQEQACSDIHASISIIKASIERTTGREAQETKTNKVIH